MVRDLAVTVREMAAYAIEAKKKGVHGLLNALRVKGKQEAEERARRAEETRKLEEAHREVLRQRAIREARERAVHESKTRLEDMTRKVQRLAPDARESFLVGEYPSDPFDRALKANRHPLGAAGLDAEEKAVRVHLKVYQEQEKRQQTERQQAPARGRGRGRGGPSRSRSRDYDSGPSFDPF